MPTSLTLNVLGEFEVVRDGARVDLPASRKTRALLAYLALTGQAHRRDHLCSMFWEVPDDPRGALRWSLSKLRALVDEEDAVRIAGDRETVGFEGIATEIDFLAIKRQIEPQFEQIDTERLKTAAAAFRGAFLEGLELPNCPDFQTWCLAEREDARKLQARILDRLVERLDDSPDDALPYARARARTDPYELSAHATLLRLLLQANRRAEAERQYESAQRVFRELGPAESAKLSRAWSELRQGAGAPASPRPASDAAAARAASLDDAAREDAGLRVVPRPEEAPVQAEPRQVPFVGRDPERAALAAALDSVLAERREKAVLLSGEPGFGKSRLAGDLIARARARGATVLDGRAYEAEASRPYGPWIDALRRVPAIAVGDVLARELVPLLPELGDAAEADRTRDQLYAAVVELIAARAHSAAPVLIVFHDVQWFDHASASLLHYVVRMNKHRPVLVLMSCNEGALHDNPSMLAILRAMRQDRLVTDVALKPLSLDETARLVQLVAPHVDAQKVARESGGNPLFAVELARSQRQSDGTLPPSLAELVRQRVEHLPETAADILRWCAVLGPRVAVAHLEKVADVPTEQLVDGIETLERRGLLRALPPRPMAGPAYGFAYELMRRVVVDDISAPRRRLMHLRIARALNEAADLDGATAAAVARHAWLGGDAALAARACVKAGKRCLRVFASAEAVALARRGMTYVQSLPEPERVRLSLELLQISFTARVPNKPDEAIRQLEELSERALDYGSLEHARRGYHMIAFLRWEHGDSVDAERNMLRAEAVSRSGNEKERVLAMGEAARCLVMLERDLGHAEALSLEALALSRRIGVEPNAVSDALGMLRAHQGATDEAAERFRASRTAAWRDGDRVGEFLALEHLVALELDRDRYRDAAALCDELVELSGKLRDGSEAPFANVMAALIRYGQDGSTADALERNFEALALADAKHRLAFALNRAARIDLRRNRPAQARAHAAEALRIARLINRPTEIAFALLNAAQAAAAEGDVAAQAQHTTELRRMLGPAIAARVRGDVEAYLGEAQGRHATSTGQEGSNGKRHRRKNS